MPNLVGIGLSQVPTNSMLGGLAYQDPEHASIKDLDLKNLSQINSEITGTAYDTFVYDTRKDSDGGAWRKRTQHTSWYNITNYEDAYIERGSRKEFPSVAVLVADSSGFGIYDGDDPDLSLWMKFKTNSKSAVYIAPNPGALAALNGVIFVGANNGASGSYTSEFGFIHDKMRLHQDSGKNQTRDTWVTGMVQKSDGTSWVSQASPISISNDHQLIDRKTNDIAMTVLPNAPIDEVSGLPRPTIAVATQGGTNIIKDDGTVTQGYTAAASENVDIHSDGYMIDAISGASNDNFSFYDISDTTRKTFYDNRIGVSAYQTFLNQATGECLFEGSSNKLALAQSLGLLRIEEEFSDYDSGLHNRTTSSYNTGWMHGDIKGAFLSDTDTTNAIEYVQNGYFNNDVSSWTIGSTGTTATLNANRLLITAPSSGTSWGYVYQGITTEIGKTYKISLHYDRGNVDGRINVRNDSSNTVSGALFYADLGTSNDGKTYYNTFTATATTTYILLYAKSTSGGTSAYDEVSVTLEKDRSVNNKGLQVFGTVTKSAVATGAELVGYSGWSSSNHLKQPYNSDLDFGTNDFCIIGWINATGNNSHQGIIHRNTDGVASSAGFLMEYRYIDDNLLLQTDNGSAVNNMFSATNSIPANVWTHFCAFVTNSGTRMGIYINGEISNSANYGNARNVNNAVAVTYIGREVSHAEADRQFYGSIALLRVSGSVPSAEQIKKMYEDEKVLFQENAKATLYGTSDAVTALAFDDSTNLLYAGTSSGRSEFQGLRRINNTTEAVTTAISASNGLVAEQ